MKRRPNGKFLSNNDNDTDKANRMNWEIKRIEQLPDEGTRLLQVTIPPDLHKFLRVEAATLDVHLKDRVTEILMRELGQSPNQIPPQQADKRTLTIQMPNKLFKVLKTRAVTENVSLSDFVITALENR
jgi:predicted HicB family RNase H-like nuclease